MTELWDHQKLTVKRGLELQSLALLQDPGVGKTLSMIRIIEDMTAKKNGRIRCLIFAPKAVLPGWKKEFRSKSDISQSNIYVIGGTTNKRLRVLSENVIKDCIQIINYEALRNDDVFGYLMKWKPNILILDESHRCKGHGSKQANKVFTLSRDVPHKFLMTGTPILNNEMDIYQQFKILDGGERFGRNFWAFRAKYFEDENASWSHQQNHFPKWKLKDYMLKEFTGKVDSISVKVRKSECLDLPPLIQKDIDIEMLPDQKRMYEEMKTEFITYIKSDHSEPQAVVAQFALHKGLRLQQITCGFAKTDEGNIIKCKRNPKLSALEDLLIDIVPNEKVIVWAHFQPNQDDILAMCEKFKGLKAYGWDYAQLIGRTKDKEANIVRFSTDDSCRILVASQSAGGVGVNLQVASTAIYFSKGPHLEHDIQSIARCYRGGSDIHSKITRIDLVCKGTIDEALTHSLKNKESIANLIMGWEDKV